MVTRIRFHAREWDMRTLRRRLTVLLPAILVALAPFAAASAQASGSSPAAGLPRACLRSFDPYKMPLSFLRMCKDGVYPVQRTIKLPGGGEAYVYDVAGVKTTEYFPPPGFNPLTASQARLAEYDYPARPGGGVALRTWLRAMRSVHPARPAPFLVTDTALETLRAPDLASRPADGPNATSSNWAGNMATSHTYTNVYGYWLEPGIYASQCSPTAESTWVGLGGWNTNTLAQDGTAYGEGGYGLGAHQAWYELISGSTNHFVPVPLYATVGGEFYSIIDRVSGGYHIYMENVYTGAPYATTASFSPFDGSTAEMIVEDPGGGYQSSGLYLSNFKSFEVEDAEASDDNGGAYHGLANWAHDDVIMKSPSDGATMAEATSAFNSGDSWYDDQLRCY
jgi:hypothetical protein